MMSIQDKISTKLAPLQRKLFDNQINLMGSSTKVIRLQVITDKYMDETITVINNDVIEIILKIPSEIPLYRLTRDTTSPVITEKTGLYLYDILPIEGYSRFEDNVEKGDIIIKKIYDENMSTDPLLLILRVSEPLGGISSNSLVWKKFNCSPHNMTLTSDIKQIIQAY